MLRTHTDPVPQRTIDNFRAQRIESIVAAVGDREQVIAGVDCGFGTFVGWEWVTEDVVWAKLKTLREGADIASRRLWGRKAT